jgi:hypothetical protein
MVARVRHAQFRAHSLEGGYAMTRQGRLDWVLDATRCHGEASTRHWLFGRRAVALRLEAGRLVEYPDTVLDLELRMVIAPRGGDTVHMTVRASRFIPGDARRLTSPADVDVKGRVARVELRLHDLGRSAAGSARRRFLTVSLRTASALLPRTIWSWPGIGAGTTTGFFVHSEWIPDEGVPAADALSRVAV